MAELKWIKIVTDIFENQKVCAIESRKNHDRILVVWFKLMCLAGKCNKNGLLNISDNIPHSESTIANAIHRPVSLVKESLDVFIEYEMMEKINGTYVILNWSKYQSADIIERRNEYQKQVMRERRAKQKDLTLQNGYANSYANVSTTDIDIEKDIEKEEERGAKEIKGKHPTTTALQPPIDYESIIAKWNELPIVPHINSIDHKRRESVQARVRESGIESFFKMIDNIKQSPFLLGKVNGTKGKPPFRADFDWCIAPNNFTKVLEGKYIDIESNPQETLEEESARRAKAAQEYLRGGRPA